MSKRVACDACLYCPRPKPQAHHPRPSVHVSYVCRGAHPPFPPPRVPPTPLPNVAPRGPPIFAASLEVKLGQ